MQAANVVGVSPDSDEITVIPGRPVKPELSAAPGDRSATLSASTSSDSGIAITGWEYQQKTGDDDYGAWTGIPAADISSNGMTMTHTVTGLVNGTAYTFRVRAANSTGNSQASDDITVVPATVPSRPTLTGTPGDASVRLSATASTDSGSAITKWQYEQKTGDDDYGAWVDIAATGTSMTHNITGLVNGTVYMFRVRAVNNAGNSSDSNEITVTAGVPARPTLSAAHGDASVVLSASTASDNGSAITKWQYHQKTGNNDYGAWVDIADTGTSIAHTVTGLSNGTSYTFKVRAVNSAGNSSDSDEVTATPVAVPPKPVLLATPRDSSAVFSAWVSSVNGSAISGWQYQQKAGGSDYGAWVDIADTGPSMAHTVTGLSNGTAYTFRVRAVNGIGNSPESDEVTVTPGVPVKPVLSAVSGDSSAVLSASVSNTNGSDITGWQYRRRPVLPITARGSISPTPACPWPTR